VQRCQVHKMRNVLEYLSDRDRPWAQAILRRAYQATDVKKAQQLLLNLARRLEDEYPSAAASVREGLDETLTVIGLGSVRAAPAIARHHERGRESHQPHAPREAERQAVARRKMMLRWVAAGILEAVKGFRRLKGQKLDSNTRILGRQGSQRDRTRPPGWHAGPGALSVGQPAGARQR
jgi:putative transposase